MTSGEKLKISLGLGSHKTVYISRLILPHTQKVVIVYYNTLRKDSSFSKQRCVTPPFTSMLYSGKDLYYDQLQKPVQTPLLSIETWNGDLNNYMVLVVDVAYSFHLSKRDFDRLPENISIFYPKGRLKEITLSDLANEDVISDFTKVWRQDKNRVKGAENRTAKLIDCVIDQANNYITFQFLTEATELSGKNPNPKIDSPYKLYKEPKKELDPETKKLKSNNSKTYEIQIRILNFFDWLDVFEGTEITVNNLKEILEVSDVQVSSTSPSFLFQGNAYWLHQIDSSIVPEDRAPKRWNASHLHGNNGSFLSKDLYGVIRQISFFRNQMASMLTKKLKERGLI